MSDKPGANVCWIAGYPKSGTTWVRHFLAAYTWGNLELNMPMGVSDVMRYIYQSVAADPITALEEWEVAALRNAVITHMVSFMGKGDRLWIKTHNAMGNWAGIQFFVQPLYRLGIYIIRDPRDIVDSLSDHTGLNHDEAITFMTTKSLLYARDSKLYHAVSSWDHNVQTWNEKGKAPGPVLTVRYEDLPNAFRKVAEFITPAGEVVDDEKLVKAIELCEFSRMQKLEENEKFNEKSPNSERFFRYGKVGRWKEVLSDEQVQKIEAAFGETMKRFGYKLSTEESNDE